MRAIIAVILGLLSTPALSGFAEHWSARNATIAAHARTTGIGKTVIFGDSNTEGFWWSSINGCWTINAGLGWATIHDAAQYATQIAASTRPRIVHIMLGTNMPPAGDPLWGTMDEEIVAVIDAFKAYGSKVVVWPVPPIGPAAVPGRDNARRAATNAILQAAASATGSFWDWWWPNQITQGPHVGGVVTNNYAVAGALEADDIHFAASTQLSRYNRIEVWRQHIKTTTGTDCQ